METLHVACKSGKLAWFTNWVNINDRWFVANDRTGTLSSSQPAKNGYPLDYFKGRRGYRNGVPDGVNALSANIPTIQ